MICKLFISIPLTLFAFSLFAQQDQFEEYIRENRFVSCEDVSYNAANIVEAIYANDDIDSLYQFLDYWSSKCGIVEEIFRLKTILDIKTGKFNAALIDGVWIEYMITYRSKDLPNYVQHVYPALYQTYEKFSELTRAIVLDVEEPLSVDAKLLLQFYGMDSPSFEDIKKEDPSISRLKYFHKQKMKETEKLGQSKYALITGYYQPFGSISKFGVRPTVGLLFGGKVGRHDVDFVLDIRIGRSKEAYSVWYKQDTLVTTKDWTGIYAGLEYTYDFIDKKKFSVGVSTGVGYEGITAITADNEFGEDPKILNTFNYNGGLNVKIIMERNWYLGFQPRYNVVNYKNRGSEVLDGNYFNLRLIVGFMGDYFRDNTLEALQ